jgi:hypothetical protein
MTVYPIVVDRLHDYYRNFVRPENIIYDKSVAAAHSMVTENYGHPCAYQGDGNRPEDIFINDCDYDAAGKLLAHILGPMKVPATTLSGSIVAFDQAEFIADPVGHSMNPAGYAYVPADCDDGAACRVHVAFHGCRQQPARIGDRFYVNAGYNRWADTNRIIVLYPQTINSDLPPVYNPRGCWDWWGLRRREFRQAKRAADARGEAHARPHCGGLFGRGAASGVESQCRCRRPIARWRCAGRAAPVRGSPATTSTIRPRRRSVSRARDRRTTCRRR